MKFCYVICLILTGWQALAGEIALTFDDAPRSDTAWFTGEKRAELLLEKLKKVDVEQVAFFSVSSRLSEGDGDQRMKAYVDAGHLIANHTHTHPWIHKVGPKKYIKDIQQAHELLKDRPGFVNWFRYPYLDQGRFRRDQLDIFRALSDLGYMHGYVTVDNYDWYMDAQLQKAVKEGKEVDLDALRKMYVDIMWDCIQFYDELALKTLGRSPKHVLLLHENDLAALFIDDLVAHIRQKGWRIISPVEAYTDLITSTYPMKRCRQGRLACLARETGYKGRTGHVSEDEVWLDEQFARRKVAK